MVTTGGPPGVFRGGYAKPPSSNLGELASRIAAFPQALVSTEAPESKTSLPQSDQYRESRYNYDKESTNESLHELTVNYIYFRDSIDGGYSPIAVYNNGAGQLVIDGIVSGTNVAAIDINMDILPNANSTYDLGSASKGWADTHVDDLYVANIRNRGASSIRVYDAFIPGTTATYALGTTSNQWSAGYIDNLHIAQLHAQSGLTQITVYEDFVPSANDTWDLGSSSHSWRILWLSQHMNFDEMTAPSGVSNVGRVYAEDNGAGKTRLMVIFGSGAAQQIAIQP
jgi:hypothetical protein